MFTTSGTYPWSFVTQIFHNNPSVEIKHISKRFIIPGILFYYLQMSICTNKNETWISKMTTIICNSCEQHFLQMIRCNGVYKAYNMLFRRDVIGSHDLACLVVKIAPFQLDLLWRVNFKLLQLSYITE